MARHHIPAPVATAYLAFVLIGVSAGIGGVLLPAQMHDYGIDRATIGITFFTFSAGFMAAGATAGMLVHRLGVRLALAAGGAIFAVAALGSALRPPFAALVAIQVVAGYGVGTVESVLNAYLSEQPGMTVLLNRLHAFFGVGALIGPAMAAWMLGFSPWTAVLLVVGVASVPLTIAFLLVGFPARPTAATGPAPGSGTDPGTDPGAPAVPATSGRGLLGVALRTPAVLLGATFLAVYVGLEVSVGNWGFSFLISERDLTDLLAGYTVSGYWLGLTVGRFVISPVAERIGLTSTGMAFACLAGVAASAAVIWIAPVAAVAGVGLVLLGFFLGPLFPTAMAAVPRLTASRLVPTAIGLMNGISVVGGSALPWLAGTIAQTIGVWTLPPFVVLLALAQLVIWRLVVDRMTPVKAVRLGAWRSRRRSAGCPRRSGCRPASRCSAGPE